MPLNGPDPFRPGIPEVSEAILRLERDLTEVRDGRRRLKEEYERGKEREESTYRRAAEGLREKTEGAAGEDRASWQEELKRLEDLREKRLLRIFKAAGTIRRELKERREEERRRFAERMERIEGRFAAEGGRRREPLERRVRRWEELLPKVRERGREVEETVREFAIDHGVAVANPPSWPGNPEKNADPDRLRDGAERSFEDLLESLASARRWWGNSLARLGPQILYHVLLLVAGVAGVVLVVELDAPRPYLGLIPLLAAAGILLLRLARRMMRQRYHALAQDSLTAARQTVEEFSANAEAALRHLDGRHIALAERQAAKLTRAQAKEEREMRERSAPHKRRLDRLAEREERAKKRLFARHELRVEAIEAQRKAEREGRESGHQAEAKRREREHCERMEALEKTFRETTRDLAERRETALQDFTRFVDRAGEMVRHRHRAWSDIDPHRIELPESFPTFVPFGWLELSEARLLGEGEEGPMFRLPAALSFPEQGSLLVRHTGAEREAALRILFDAVLRALLSFPAGRARLTIIDPVGLGQSFSALMHLADQDEALVNSQIWTETLHIQHRLEDLTRHIEKVIQKYLRNRYHTIAEYNEVAGELQEPFHFLVIADFPSSFNEIAAEHLSSILNSGPRCGVYTLIAQDARLPVPPGVELDVLRRHGTVLVPSGTGFRIEAEGPNRADFLPEAPPAAEFVTTLLDTVGRLSVDADKVEVPFDAVVPETLWSGSTDRGVRVPIGRTGAERLQFLDLGRGTAQHALVAGRTGSGKSTLFHVMITALSLWFSPDEVEFYLIDFKKGVEFKPFATHRLPHARVVAIESDREFGLSVLKAVDAELSRRGDLFRHHGVQDLAAFRRCGSTEVVPRTLLLIDEFQEYFTEDDFVAREAALLLDRFVRQGRAFGIHVVLGSQTLSGIYALAKSTIGQMGVRISLQCDEADSYLILSEDNGVARLLTRPGEAIYNDRSGLVEGNNPFQVVWLPEHEEARYLGRLADRAAASKEPGTREIVVFEGNLPARIAENRELAGLLEGSLPRGEDDRVWLGDPNAIKGPTEVRFLPASGSNLLIVGQRRDAAFALMAASVLALSGQYGEDEVRFVILDGGGHEEEYVGHFENLSSAVPRRIDRYDLREAPEAVAELAAGLDRPAGKATYVFAFGLQRLRSLRREDAYSMSFTAEEKESTGEQFARLLTDGPPQNLHTIVWCDTVTNLLRVLERRMLREFDLRVLFQMSAADSSELIDSTAANLLGLTSALLATESRGTFEKFRPYSIPDRGTLEALVRRGRPSAARPRT